MDAFLLSYTKTNTHMAFANVKVGTNKNTLRAYTRIPIKNIERSKKKRADHNSLKAMFDFKQFNWKQFTQHRKSRNSMENLLWSPQI